MKSNVARKQKIMLPLILLAGSVVLVGLATIIFAPHGAKASEATLKLAQSKLDGTSLSDTEVATLLAQVPEAEKALAEPFANSLRGLHACMQAGNASCLAGAASQYLQSMDELAKNFEGEFQIQLSRASNYFFVASSSDNFGVPRDELMPRAVSMAEELKKRFPSEPLALGHLAFVYRFNPEKKAEAKALVEECLRLDPQQSYCRSLQE